MKTALTRIDPALPICWEDDRTLRVGFDRAEARVSDPSAPTQRIISALREGIDRDRVRALVQELGITRAEWSELAELLAPALVCGGSADQPPASLCVGVLGAEGVSDAFVRSLRFAGHRATRFSPRQRGYDLVIVLERFMQLPVIPDYRWAAGRPQLLVRFTDRSVSVGPLVSAEGSPCLSCVMMHDIDEDPALPAIAAQLIGHAPAAEQEAAIEAATALALSVIRHWQAGGRLTARHRWRVDVSDGLPGIVPEQQNVRPHGECGCGLTSAA